MKHTIAYLSEEEQEAAANLAALLGLSSINELKGPPPWKIRKYFSGNGLGSLFLL